ncbi:hypothetical protein M3J09_011769 [Ascochyta lentis]
MPRTTTTTSESPLERQPSENEALQKETLHHHSTASLRPTDEEIAQRQVTRRRSLHGKLLLCGVFVTLVLGLGVGLGLGLTVGRYGRSS